MGLLETLAYARKACLDITTVPLVLSRKTETRNTKTGGWTESAPTKLAAQDVRIARPSYRVFHPLKDMADGNGMLYDWIVMFDATNPDVQVGDTFINPKSNYLCEIRVVDEYHVHGVVGAVYAMAIEARA